MTNKARKRTRARLEEREREILDAATQLFASAGFHAVSTRKIAAAAGVSEGTVFHYFGSKNDLMLGILDRFYNGILNPRAGEILDTVMDTRSRLRELARHHVDSLASDNALMMRLLQVYVGIDFEFLGTQSESPLRTLNRDYVQHLDRIVREGIERRELRSDLEVRSLRDVFFGTLEYGLRTHIARMGTQGLDSYVDALIEPIWRGIAASNSSPPSANAMAARLEKTCQRLDEITSRLEKSTAD